MSTPNHLKTAGAIIRERGGPSLLQETASVAAVELSVKRDRLPPHSLEAEQGMLGCCLLDPAEAIPTLAERTVEDSFYDLRHRTIREAMLKMAEAGVAVDMITLSQWLKDRQQLEAVGGLAYLTGLQDCTPSAANAPEYLRVLREKMLLRRLSNLCVTTAAAVHATEDEPDELVSQFEEKALQVREVQVQERPNREVMLEVVNQMQREAAGDLGERLMTGIADFDHKFLGYPPKSFVIVAGRPSTGKTAIGLHMIRHMARSVSCGVISVEMPQDQLLRRMTASEAGASDHPSNLRHINQPLPDGRPHPQMVSLVKAAGVVSKLPISIVDKSPISVQQIAAIARRWVKRHKIKVLLVDYLQLVVGSSKRGRDDRRLEVAEISAGLKNLAKSLNIVVICLAQLNRAVEQRGPASRPRKSDLRECGDIEQDADFIQFLWAEVPPEEQEDPVNKKIIMSLSKNRNGPTGDVHLMFRMDVGRFDPVSRLEHEEENRPRHKN